MGSYAGKRRPPSGSGWIKFALLGVIISIFTQGVFCETEPTESQCRPFIEKALKEQHVDIEEKNQDEIPGEGIALDQDENLPTDELIDSIDNLTKEAKVDDDEEDNDGEVREEENDEDDLDEKTESLDDGTENQENENTEEQDNDDGKTEIEENNEADEDRNSDEENRESIEETSKDVNVGKNDDKIGEDEYDNDKDKFENNKMVEDDNDNDDDDDEGASLQRPIEIEVQEIEINDKNEEADDEDDESDDKENEADDKDEEGDDKDEKVDEKDDEADEIDEEVDEKDDEGDEKDDEGDEKDDEVDEKDDEAGEKDDEAGGKDDEAGEKDEEADDKDEEANDKDNEADDKDGEKDEKEEDSHGGKKSEINKEADDDDDDDDDDEQVTQKIKYKKSQNYEREKSKKSDEENVEDETEDEMNKDQPESTKEKKDKLLEGDAAESDEADSSKEDDDQESTPEEEDLIKEVIIPENLRPRDHISKILKLEDSEVESLLEKTIDTTLKSLKGLYDNAIKPLEMLYKYRDLSNRHFGDPEIFSKPLVLFMGPWSGGKSSTINYLLDNEFSQTSLRTGAEPSPAYFNILMHGEEEEILDGTQLAADWTFSGLQKFGQGLLDRLRGIKLNNKLLEKVNIVEIPGILEIRKQVQRLFPFNDACQWFIDRADIIFLVYDPSKLDVGPETEAILDQLKGREYQTRIILNKADQVKPEELMRVQGTLIWNISPLMSSTEPPIMYSTSLWSMPYETGAPTRLLLAQERAFLRDLREAIDKRVENKIASARRFAVRVRNHAKMVDCYLTTYYNHKSFFGNRKKISDDIIEYPQKYHIYEGLSTLTNISRYDLPDPDVYRDFFKINPLYEFKKLSETCTYFRGCPINKLDVAIAYDLPELVGKYKKAVEAVKEQLQKENS